MTKKHMYQAICNIKNDVTEVDPGLPLRIVFDSSSLITDNVIFYKKKNNMLYIRVSLTDSYFEEEYQYNAAVQELVKNNGEIDLDNYPDVEEMIKDGLGTLEEEERALFGEGGSSTGVGTLTFSIMNNVDEHETAFVMADNITKVFGTSQRINPYSKPKTVRDRRHNDVFMTHNVPPKHSAVNPNSPNQKPNTIRIYFDNSGSMLDADLMLSEGIYRRLKRIYPECDFELYSFTTEVNAVNKARWNNLTGYRVGGGTRLTPVLDHMENNPSKINLIISDMEFDELCSNHIKLYEIPKNTVLISTRKSGMAEDAYKLSGVKEELCFMPPTD